MLIDWFTVAAQIVNFIILVLLLRRFLYGRILRAIDLRDKEIGGRLKKAEEKEEKAEEEAEKIRQKEKEIEDRREELLVKAREDAERARAEMLKQAGSEVEEQKSLWRKALARDKDEFLGTVREKARREFFLTSKKALKELASEDLEGAVVKEFLNRLRGLPDSEWRTLSTAAGKSEKVRISSAFELRETERADLEAFLKQRLDGAEIVYSTNSDLIAGIEASFSGKRYSWDINSYLEDLERRLGETFESMEADGQRS